MTNMIFGNAVMACRRDYRIRGICLMQEGFVHACGVRHYLCHDFHVFSITMKVAF